ncbi:hypothetical protein PAXY110619_08025 [Paenibacillus xylanexedens]
MDTGQKVQQHERDKYSSLANLTGNRKLHKIEIKKPFARRLLCKAKGFMFRPPKDSGNVFPFILEQIPSLSGNVQSRCPSVGVSKVLAEANLGWWQYAHRKGLHPLHV